MRLSEQPTEHIDRDAPLRFTYAGKEVPGFAGDTVGSALYAAGRRVFSRSFKYHRPRGLLCCAGSCPNCLMTVDGVPNVRVCVEPLRPGMDVRDQNVVGSADRDLLGLIDKVGRPFTPVGFYYRTMIRPRRAWPLYEKALRNVAGLGRVDNSRGRDHGYDTVHRRVDVLVVGGGPAGRAAAAAAAAGGTVLLVDDRAVPEASYDHAGPEEPYEVLAPATALAIYEGGLVPVASRSVLYRIRAERIVVAAGALEQPLVFPGNDLVGVMLPDGVRRMVDQWALKPGRRAVLVGQRAAQVTPQLERAGVDVAAVTAKPASLSARGRKGRLQYVRLDGERIDCDLLVVSDGLQPAYSLLAQAGARIDYEPSHGIFVPTELPAGVEVVGDASGQIEQNPMPAFLGGSGDKCFVCICEDVTTKDMKRAVAEGFDSIELAKRYTTVTMGPCQGKLCQLASTRALARETGTDESAIGSTTARPPWEPVELGLLAGHHFEPTRRSPLQRRHVEAGATLMWTGQWLRPHSYGDVAAEVRTVHHDLGLIDVSTLGKILIEGPEAAELLESLYPNRFGDLEVGRIRYGVLTTDGGRIFDDGTVGRLDDELFYVTTTSTGADSVCEWFEWWNAVWGYDVEIVNVTGALAAMNVAGPRARTALAELTDADLSNEAFRYLDAKELRIAGVPCLGLRIGFVGELGYELHCAASLGERVWDALIEQGARPFGLEAQRVLRLEKGHIIVGQDTDSESNLISARMPWIIKRDKEDFVGKWAVPYAQQREQLVGFTIDSGVLPLEGAQIVDDGHIAGRVTSVRTSEVVGKTIGLAWVTQGKAEEGATVEIRVDGRLHEASVTLAPFYDPEGVKLRS